MIDEFKGIMDYKEEIEDPKEECKDLLIWLYASSSDKYEDMHTRCLNILRFMVVDLRLYMN